MPVVDTSAKPGLLVVGNFLSAKRGTRSPCEDLSDRLQAQGWRVMRTSYQTNKLLRLIGMVTSAWTQRNSYQCALVDVFSGPAFRWAELVCKILRLADKPYILVLHGGGLVDYSGSQHVRVAALLKSASIVVTPSRFLQEGLAKFRDDIRYLPNGLSLSNYEFAHRARLVPKIVWLRAFHEIYNPMLAVKVVDRLRNDYPDIHLIMYGPDKGDGSLTEVQDYIATRNLQGVISIPGAIPKLKVPGLLSNNDIFLNTTTLESFGLCVAEAAACGLPVVSTAVGELPLLWRNGDEVILVHDGDVEAMADGVRHLLNDSEFAGTLSLNARKKVEMFDWNIILPQWESLFSEAVVSRN